MTNFPGKFNHNGTTHQMFIYFFANNEKLKTNLFIGNMLTISKAFKCTSTHTITNLVYTKNLVIKYQTLSIFETKKT